MKLRIGSITFLLFLSSVAFPQATSRYLDKPLPQGWEEDTQIFQQVLPVDDQWWKGPRSRLTHLRCSQAELFGTDCD